jgi:hypothetical protein
VRQKEPLARCCLHCFEWIEPDSRAMYCSAECRRKARRGSGPPGPRWLARATAPAPAHERSRPGNRQD